jgi:hypothetical protein
MSQIHLCHSTQNCAQPLRPPLPIEECLIVPHFVFANIFQLKAYGQYGLHGSVTNIPTNLNVVQLVFS